MVKPSEKILALPKLLVAEHKQLPHVQAIYIVFDEHDNVLYVGMTRALKRRWQNHHRMVQFIHYPNASIRWFNVGSASSERLKEIEDIFIEKLCPPLNNTSIKYYEMDRIIANMF